jgi:AcrR family transcriptional regulator
MAIGHTTGTDRHTTDTRIVEATLALLRGGGPGAVTVEAVTARSGVAKTTIYRRYRNRDDMLRAALEQVTTVPLPAPEVPTREKVRWMLNEFRADIEHVLGLGTVAAILTDADPGFTDLYRGMLTPYNELLIDLFDAAADAGDLRSDLDADAALNLLLGSYLAEHLRHGHIRDDWLDRTLTTLWAGLAPS